MIDITWGEQYATGNEKIDHQHQVFFDLIRASSEAIDNGHGEEPIRRALHELALYAKFHFYFEESLMINSDYPETESHVSKHEVVFSTLKEKIDDYFADNSTGEELVVFIFEWLVAHTLTVDKELAEYLSSQELLAEA